jgi:hypothetical protein
MSRDSGVRRAASTTICDCDNRPSNVAGSAPAARITSAEFYYLDTEPLLKVIIESGSGHAVDLIPAYTYPPPRDSATE